MLELKIRGYVTPEDFEGTDAERIQKAIDCAKDEDIRKVVLCGEYKLDTPAVVPGNMHIIFDNVHLCGDIVNDISDNYSFESDRLYIEGKNSVICGNVRLCHTRHAVLENIQIDGNVTLEYSRDFRMENVEITKELLVGRGCKNLIVQYIKCGNVLMSGEDKGYDIIGRDPLLKNILLRDSEITDGAILKAAEDCGFLNIQIDGIRSQKTGVTVGTENEELPKEQYQNLTFTDIDAPSKVIFNNEYMFAYID